MPVMSKQPRGISSAFLFPTWGSLLQAEQCSVTETTQATKQVRYNGDGRVIKKRKAVARRMTTTIGDLALIYRKRTIGCWAFRILQAVSPCVPAGCCADAHNNQSELGYLSSSFMQSHCTCLHH
ncbi:hypothetical protein F5J12DRAFT_190492 [Pisolithus orientalis]|uniref:uncharacterized protein n=1 Tax=Pisolithus orientalis TaxID=936130 RepID=UPI002225AC8C|nr:uncharacterized protein F5J12DRAFT_190492 [Pisolithus orientalis]KAI6032915.1 hypothetical protein F5J12DRAFT_190492 [Pisolithus orientalis]